MSFLTQTKQINTTALPWLTSCSSLNIMWFSEYSPYLSLVIWASTYVTSHSKRLKRSLHSYSASLWGTCSTIPVTRFTLNEIQSMEWKENVFLYTVLQWGQFGDAASRTASAVTSGLWQLGPEGSTRHSMQNKFHSTNSFYFSVIVNCLKIMDE